MGNFQNVFKHLRIASGLTQQEIADKLGISRSTIGMYETGAREPDYETLEMIADFFNVDIDYLLGRTNKTTILPESTYYLNDDARDLAQFMFENPEYKVSGTDAAISGFPNLRINYTSAKAVAQVNDFLLKKPIFVQIFTKKGKVSAS